MIWSFIWKGLFVSSILPKNKQNNSTQLLWYLRLNCFCSFLWKNLKFKFFQSKSVDGTNFWTVKRLKLVAIFRWWYWPKMNLSVVHFVRCTGYWFFKTYTYSLFNSSLGKISTVWTFHTVSFDWFLSGLEWNLSFEFCLQKLLAFSQKLLWNIRSRINSSTFWVLRPIFRDMFDQNLHFLSKKLQFWSNISKYRLKKPKNVEELSLYDIP